MYYSPQPPFLIPLLGIFISVTFGLTFKKMLEDKLISWAKNKSDSNAYKLEGANLNSSYLGVCLGVWIFLSGGIHIFGFGVITSFGFCLPLAIATGAFIWKQLQELLIEYQQGGLKAINIDE